MTGDHRFLYQSFACCNHLSPEISNAYPGSGIEFKIFSKPAIEKHSFVGIIFINKLQCITGTIKSFFIKNFCGQFRLPPVPGKNIFTPISCFQFASDWQLILIPDPAREHPSNPAKPPGSLANKAEGQASVQPKPCCYQNFFSNGFNSQLLPCIPNMLRHTRTGIKQHPEIAEKLIT